MENLIDFNDADSKSHYAIPLGSNKIFGVIKRECAVIDLTEMDDNNKEFLKPGSLIQIISGYHDQEHCHFKMRNFTEWKDKYKTAIYKCSKDDYIVVTAELWPYLLAFKNNEGRVKFVKSVYSREFNMDMLEMGCEIRIRGSQGAKLNYYNFVVTHNGLVKEYGTGYYIGLQLKDDHQRLSPDLILMSRFYRFGGTGIVVTVDWIMLNLYKEEQRQAELPDIPQHNDVTGDNMLIEIASEVTEENNKSSVKRPSVSGIEQRSTKTNIINTGQCLPEIVCNNPLINNAKDTKYNETKLGNISAMGPSMVVEVPNTESHVISNSYRRSSEVVTNDTLIKASNCTNRFEHKSGMTEYKQIEFESTDNNLSRGQSTESSKVNEKLMNQHKVNEDRISTEYSVKSYCDASGSVSQRHTADIEKLINQHKVNEDRISAEYSVKSLCDASGSVSQNHTADIEKMTNVEGSVKNSEKTNCDLCANIIEIRQGVILRECLHSFCMRCIRGHVERNAKYTGVRCPYRKEYECQFDILDSEIKDLGGVLVYNKILDNRLKEYVTADRNVKICPIEDCKFIWVNSKSSNTHENFQQCPGCNKHWCFICNSAHEKGEQHGKEPSKTKTNGVFGWVGAKLFGSHAEVIPTVKCIKCNSNIPKNGCVKLQNCSHTFCKNCIEAMIKTQTSGSKYAQCICREKLDDNEVSKITSFDVLQIFKDNRNNQTLAIDNTRTQNTIIPKCYCKAPTKDCFIELRCNDKFCRTLLTDVVRNQLHRGRRCVCPICCVEIDEKQIKSLVYEPDVLGECRSCSYTAEVQLKICQHSFCRKCVRDIILSQADDPKATTINCTCNQLITDTDIKRYGNEEALTKFKSKNEVTQTVPTPAGAITLNQKPFVCLMCEESILVKCGVILARCNDHICLLCCRNVITQQLSSSLTPACPICLKLLEEFEVNAILDSVDMSTRKQKKLEKNRDEIEQHLNIFEQPKLKVEVIPQAVPKPVYQIKLNNQLFECVSCDEQISIKGGVILSSCDHIICLPCCKQVIEQQLSHSSRKPVCPVCGKFFDQIEVDAIMNYKISFECLKCEGLFEEHSIQKCLKCSNPICLKCAKSTMQGQMGNGLAPNCPFCQTLLDNSQIVSILNPLDNKKEVEIIFECIVCKQPIERPFQIELTKCKHRICLMCFQQHMSKQMCFATKLKCPECFVDIDPIQLAANGISTSNKSGHDLTHSGEIISTYELAAKTLTTTSHVSNAVLLKPNSDSSTPLQMNSSMFECVLCEKMIDAGCGIILVKCKHPFCRECISTTILKQSSNGIAPNCPMCEKQITDVEVRALNTGMNDIVENRLRRNDAKEQHDEFEMISKMPNVICAACEENYDTIFLTTCSCRFCRKCLTSAWREQFSKNKKPSCPLCSVEVGGVDIMKLRL